VTNQSETPDEKANALKQIAAALFRALRSIDSELLAYQMALVALSRTNPEEATLFSMGIAVAKKSSPHAEILRERYDVPLKEILDKVQGEQDLLQALRISEDARSKPLN